MATTNFSGPVSSAGGFVGDVTLGSYTVATVPAAAGNTGRIIYVTDGAAGNPVVAYSNGTDWIRSDDSTLAIADS